jgi:hypothetical protein
MHTDAQRVARLISVPFGESGSLVGLSRRTMYDEWKRGRISHIRSGITPTRTRVGARALGH